MSFHEYQSVAVGDQEGVGLAQFASLALDALLEGDHVGVVLGAPAHLGQIEAGAAVVVLDDYFAHFFDKFFEVFDDRGLAFVYQEKTSDGQTSRFNKLVSRDS